MTAFGPDFKHWETGPFFASKNAGAETVRDAVVRGWGYKRLCCDCGDQAELTPDQVLDRFAHILDRTMLELLPHFRCARCGSRRVQISAFQSIWVNSGHGSPAALAERGQLVEARAQEILAARRALPG